jgi:allantoicase
MGDGWETKRSRREGPDWVVVALAASGTVERVVLDTLHFKGNSPESAAVCVGRSADGAGDGWTPVLPRTRLLPHTEHVFDDVLLPHAAQVAATHARLRIWPDGGVSRMRLFGQIDDAGREASGLAWLNALTDVDLSSRLLGCCGSRAWVARMAAARPFESLAAMKEIASAAWAALPTADHDEAFRAHPRIGEKKAAGGQSAQAATWSGKEQAKVAVADAGTLAELARINTAYEQKFGRIYIVCATGRTAADMLEIARTRLENDPVTEAREAALAQDAITHLRLAKLVRGDA